MLRIFNWLCERGSSLDCPVVKREVVWSCHCQPALQDPLLSPSAWVFTVFDLLTNFVTGEKRYCVEHLSISNFSIFLILLSDLASPYILSNGLYFMYLSLFFIYLFQLFGLWWLWFGRNVTAQFSDLSFFLWVTLNILFQTTSLLHRARYQTRLP